MIPDALTERLRPIGLAELNEHAELQGRVDRKYLVDARVLEELGEWIDDESRVLEVAGSREARYQSVYFDTPDLLSFHQAARGHRRRFKLRTRAYCDSNLAFLEAKTKGSRGFTAKERIPHDFGKLSSLTDGDRNYAGTVLRSVGESAERSLELAAVLETSYRRATILIPARDDRDAASRLTVDTELRWQLCRLSPDAARSELHLPDLAIIETKSALRPSPTDRALWRHGIRPDSLSKYATGLAALQPSLPANRWARILTNTLSRQDPTCVS